MARDSKIATQYSNLRESAEALIRAGNFNEARKLLLPFSSRKIPRDFRHQLANIARRAGDSRTALRILWPVFRNDRMGHEGRRAHGQPTSNELGEFAVALLGVGASGEAVRLLEKRLASIETPQAPLLSLYLGFGYMTQWDYVRAAPCFQNFLRTPTLSDYEMLVAKINLAAAYVAMANTAEAFPLLQEALQNAEANDWRLLRKNALELSAQTAVLQHDWDLAATFLDQIGGHESHSSGQYDLFAQKWRAFVRLYKSNGAPETLNLLAEVRSEGVRQQHWETVRDCDFHLATVLRDPALFLRVYFGTPFRSYSARMEKVAAGWLAIPREFIWQFGSDNGARVFDLRQGREVDGRAQLKPGQLLHRTLNVLTTDMYRPFSLGTLHSLLFPNEQFNPETGDLRVRQAVWRLRSWLRDQEIPLVIDSGRDGFRLKAVGPYGLLISPSSSDEASSDGYSFELMIERLKSGLAARSFSSTHAAKFLGVSDRQAREILRWGCAHHRLSRSGAGPATRYRFILDGV